MQNMLKPVGNISKVSQRVLETNRNANRITNNNNTANITQGASALRKTNRGV